MAVKNYGIHDKWTNINKVNNVEIQSVDGVIENIKVNGEPAGGGGFTTAQVTLENASVENIIQFNVPQVVLIEDNNTIMPNGSIRPNTTETLTVVMASGCGFILKSGTIATVAGDARKINDSSALITGDCTITIS